MGLADGPELSKGGRALDRRLVDTLGTEHVVGPAIRVDRALLRRCARRVVGTVALDNVVLDERARRPAVYG